MSVTQKRCRAGGSVTAEPEREEQEADYVPLVTPRKVVLFRSVAAVVSPTQLFGNLNYSSFPSSIKCGQNPC